MMKKKLITIATTIVTVTLSGSQIGQPLAEATKTEKNVRTHIPGIGDTIPDGSVTGIDGKPIDLHDLISKKPTVLIFYRGGWCPFCNTHLGKLQTVEQEILKSGYQIVAISPDRPAELKKSISKHSLSYSLFSDSTMEVSTSLGLSFTMKKFTSVEKFE